MGARQETSNEGPKADLLVKLADQSLAMEISRYNSLLTQSGYLLTGNSILSIALLTALGIITNITIESDCPSISYVIVVFIFLALIASMILVVCSQFRYKYKQLNPPTELREYCDNLPSEQTKNEYLCARNYADSLNSHYQGLKLRNDRILALNKASLICLLVALALSGIGIIVFAITFKVAS